MGKITINPGNLRKDPFPGEHIDRIMYSETPPPKNYIWGKDDGCYYTWNGCDWVLLNSGRGSCGCPGSGLDSYITKAELDTLLKRQKLDIIAYLKNYVNNTSCSGTASETIIREINQRLTLLESDTTILKNIDHNSFATKTELEDVHDKEKVVSASLNDLNSRVVPLEEIDHSMFITAEDYDHNPIYL